MGNILLEGGAEFGGQMEEPDRQAIRLAGGSRTRISILPTAAVPDNNHEHAGSNGVRWFQSLGPASVSSLPLTDRESANHAPWVRELEGSGLIYLLGGFPRYLAEVLQGTLAWKAMQRAHAGDAVIAGSSAGAMVLCEWYFDPFDQKALSGLNLVPGSCVIPHHDTFGQTWVARLDRLQRDVLLIGIDEQTGMLDDGADGGWHVYGKGSVTLYRKGKVLGRFARGQEFHLKIDAPGAT